jgi:stearoyl-CoA desaturase (Delta-9 desaturase)
MELDAVVEPDAAENTQPSIHRMHFWKSIPFFGVHIVALVGVIMSGWSWSGFALAVALYYLRMFGITAGYHRYFSHRSYKMGRGMQFFMALLGTTATQKGVLWWAAHHRRHHKLSDQPGDVHSVRQDGFWYSHVGWILAPNTDETDVARIKDFQKFPELRWLNKFHVVPPVALAVGLYFLAGGWWALLWGFFVSTTLLWHGTFTINSLSHVFGSRRYETTDDSKNNLTLALLTMGEGWHNNHHYYQRATNQGFYWWEVDVTYYALKALSWVGLVSDLHTPPERIRAWRGDGKPVSAAVAAHPARNAAAAAAVTAAAALAPGHVVDVHAQPAPVVDQLPPS